ncbi:hypothetical protein FS749_008244 [Ceratobasidium sp. UAMH 11750]|nr:hypothetical protein FS749_008244 [Ceratobasidium sp. UAMH 11750]
MRTAFALVAAVTFASSAIAAPTCSGPYQRKEWRELTSTQQAAFITAVKCLGDPVAHPHSAGLSPTGFTSGIAPVDTTSSRYDDFVYGHMDTNIKDHFTGLFLPWHRWYLSAFEKALRDECSYTGYLPYWDWSLDAADVSAAPVFSSNPTTGFGTFGTAANNYVVTDGAFAGVNRAYPSDHYVARNLTAYPFVNKIFPFDFANPNKKASDAFTPAEMSYIENNFSGDFVSFAAYMDGVRAQGMHNAAHLQFLPGDMSNPSFSPNDVIFFLHHANLDRVWAKWQSKSAANAASYGGGSVQDLPNYDTYPVGKGPALTTSSTIYTAGLAASDPIVADVMSTTGGYLCYTYSSYP